MRGIVNFCAATAALCLASAPAWAAAPDALDAAPVAPKAGLASISGANPYQLDAEMTVHNWVLCVSADQAESLVKARGESKEKGEAVYASLRAAKACGAFSELHVILQQPLYVPAAASTIDGHVFDALVRLSDQWAKAYVVSADQ